MRRWVRGYNHEDSRLARDVRGGREQRSRGIRGYWAACGS